GRTRPRREGSEHQGGSAAQTAAGRAGGGRAVKALAPALASARRELAANPRLRYGVLAIAAILVLYLFLVLQGWQSGLAERHATRSGYLAKMQALAGQEVWIQRAAAVARTRAALEAEIPEMATLGLAQASAQGWLRDAVSAFGQDVQVQAQTPAQAGQGSDKIGRASCRERVKSSVR